MLTRRRLIRPKQCCPWLLDFGLYFYFLLVVTESNPFYHCRLCVYACGFSLSCLHFHFVISSHIPQPYHFYWCFLCVLAVSKLCLANCVQGFSSKKDAKQFRLFNIMETPRKLITSNNNMLERVHVKGKFMASELTPEKSCFCQILV